jgi:hypothetical protein
MNEGWLWFEASQCAETESDETEQPPLAIAFARCFSTPDGRRVLQHLRACTLERALSPSASDGHLRYLEGQRQLVVHMLMLTAQGAQRS